VIVDGFTSEDAAGHAGGALEDESASVIAPDEIFRGLEPRPHA